MDLHSHLQMIDLKKTFIGTSFGWIPYKLDFSSAGLHSSTEIKPNICANYCDSIEVSRSFIINKPLYFSINLGFDLMGSKRFSIQQVALHLSGFRYNRSMYQVGNQCT